MTGPLHRLNEEGNDADVGSSMPTRSTSIQYRAPRVSLTLADFDIIRRIGDGSFSEVMQVRHKATGADYALKMVDKHLIVRHKMVDHIRTERNILDACDYTGIAKLYFTFQDEASLYLGLELCPNGELYDQIRVAGRLLAERAQFYSAEVVHMLEYLQGQRVVHRDLKPENLLLDADGHLKLVDFGSAMLLRDGQEAERAEGQRQTSLVGTADYVAPEVLSNETVTGAADLWALGCILFQMLVGKAPFKAASEYLTFQRISDGSFEIPAEAAMPADAEDLIRRLLVVQPSQRLGANEWGLLQLKSHPFFEGIDWSTLRNQPAPAFAKSQRQADVDAVGLDWEMTSLAAALPVQYSYEGSGGGSISPLRRTLSPSGKPPPQRSRSSLSLSSQVDCSKCPAPQRVERTASRGSERSGSNLSASSVRAATEIPGSSQKCENEMSPVAARGSHNEIACTASACSSPSSPSSRDRRTSVRRLSPFASDASQAGN